MSARAFYFPIPVKLTSEMLKQLDLSQSSLGKNLLTEDIGNLLELVSPCQLSRGCNIVDLLDSNSLTSCIVGGSANDAISTLPQLFGHIVPFIDNEFLVEDLEHFAALKIRHSGGVA